MISVASGDMILAEKNPDIFIEKIIKSVKDFVGNYYAIAAISGGIDSTIAAYLSWLALGPQLKLFFIDTGYMRIDEPENVINAYSEMGLEVEIIDASQIFYRVTLGLEDAEEKRIHFKEAFYRILSKYMQREGIAFLIQGTIASDWRGKFSHIKTRHNVLYQAGIKPEERYGYSVIEPLANIYKTQVRKLAHYLKIPRRLIERQPFPGPGLLIRCLGKCTLEKIITVREVTKVVEEEFSHYKSPSQYFIAISERGIEISPTEVHNFNEEPIKNCIISEKIKIYSFHEKATGIKDGRRAYGKILGIECDLEKLKGKLEKVIEIFNLKLPEYTRLLIKLGERKIGKYAIMIRSIETSDFMDAKVFIPPLEALLKINDLILEDKRVGQVFFDVTPKPPATIEYE